MAEKGETKKEEIRGKLLYKGKSGRYYDTINGQKKMITLIIFSMGVFLTYAICSIIFQITIAGSIILLEALLFFLIGILLLLLYAVGGIDIDGIYENGISSAHHTLIEYLKGKTFHPYNTISKVGYGIKKDEHSRFLSIYLNNESIPGIRAYYDKDYKNDFYKELIKVLRNKCPDIPWVKIEWESLPFTRG